MLVWFVLFIGVATAAPVLGEDGLQVACTSSGVVKLINSTSDDAPALTQAGMDCPLCASVAPISLPSLGVVPFKPAPTLPIPHGTEWLPRQLSAPALPSRGPPLIA